MTTPLYKARLKQKVSAKADILRDGILWDAYEHQRLLAMRDLGYSWARMANAYRITTARAKRVCLKAQKLRREAEESGVSWAGGFTPGRMLPIWRCFACQQKNEIALLTKACSDWTRPVLEFVSMACQGSIFAVATAQGRQDLFCPLCGINHGSQKGTEQ